MNLLEGRSGLVSTLFPAKSMSILTERDPLLKNTPSRSGVIPAQAVKEPVHSHSPGPLEITRSSRYGILAGIWLAQFLSVC